MIFVRDDFMIVASRIYIQPKLSEILQLMAAQSGSLQAHMLCYHHCWLLLSPRMLLEGKLIWKFSSLHRDHGCRYPGSTLQPAHSHTGKFCHGTPWLSSCMTLQPDSAA